MITQVIKKPLITKKEKRSLTLAAFGIDVNIGKYIVDIVEAQTNDNLVDLILMDFNVHQYDMGLLRHGTKLMMWRFLNQEVDKELKELKIVKVHLKATNKELYGCLRKLFTPLAN